ncbi:hypothetical protein [Flavobacterium sp. LC2016-01]|uniref:hypothetical protein n=1 Tax=Flavobacterium sp. LC2016-01 TaxID=2675876 RepID=UPI0012BAC871|nr:hypothetical protein [Flavobacterium sp. LC2016-01]MTH16361.1 hypothetical protein [Flavobacterium sp. LC2016-01]
MEKELGYQQIKEIKEAYLKDNLSVENQIIKLIVAGYDEKTAEELINKVIREYKRELLEAAQDESENRDIQKITGSVIFGAAILGPVLSIKGSEWYILASIVAGAAGYFDLRKQPIAGVVRSIVLVILFPLAFELYINTRSSYYIVELLIPFLICFLIAYLFQLLISKIFYPEEI